MKQKASVGAKEFAIARKARTKKAIAAKEAGHAAEQIMFLLNSDHIKIEDIEHRILGAIMRTITKIELSEIEQADV